MLSRVWVQRRRQRNCGVVFKSHFGEGERMIEKVGFYETRHGQLRYAVGRIPDDTGSRYEWCVISNQGVFSSYMSSGYFYDGKTENEVDLIRYLPTVKSWDDPIPPQYRPFCKDEFLPHSDRWLKDKHGDYFRTTSIYINGVVINANFVTWDSLHAHYKFDDGTPCGVQV